MRRVWFGLAGILLMLGITASTVTALTIPDPARDCDANAVIRCGVRNFTEIQNRSQNDGVMPIFDSFGISNQDINNISSTAVEGCVTRSGQVYDVPCGSISSQHLVATNAITAGRQNISGSTATSHGGVTFYKRPPSVSFRQSALPAFVVMNNDRFAFAIIASCGNPVNATPVVHKVAKPRPVTPAAPTKPAAPSAQPQSQTQTQSQSQSQSQTVNVVSPAPKVEAATTTKPAPAPAPATKSLPNTGPGDIFGLAAAASLAGGAGHFIYRRRRTD